MDLLKASLMSKLKNDEQQKLSSSFKDDATLSSSSISFSSLDSAMRSFSVRECEETLDSAFRSFSILECEETECLKSLADFCTENNHDFSSNLMFRIAHFHDFDFERSKQAVITFAGGKSYLKLRMEDDLATHFAKGIIFPLPELKAKDGSNVVYMRPSRYTGNKSSQLMVESLCYVLNDLSRTEPQCRGGITMLVHMRKWARDNFDQEMWVKMIRILQGDLVPTTVKQVLLVDAPEEFRKMWGTLEQIIPCSFSKKFLFVKQDKLGVFLKDGYHEYLPNDFKRGWLFAEEVAEDYIDQKRHNDRLS